MKTPQVVSTPAKNAEITVENSKKYIFAYLRKSTKKLSQEDSIRSQNESVMNRASELWINESDILKFYDEWVSGFKYVKTNNGEVVWIPRQGFSDMLKALDASDKPCILFVYDVSRLGRNMSDGMIVIEKLGIGSGQQVKISKIYFTAWRGDEWDARTRKTYIQDRFNIVEGESEKKQEYMHDNIKSWFRKDIFPPMIPTPPWLTATHEGLAENDSMPFVRQAMQMRINGRQMKDICSFLRTVWVKMTVSNISEIIFKNKLYIGTYVAKKWFMKGEEKSGLLFVNKKTPITVEFFEKLQKHLWAKKSKYGAKQEYNPILSLLRFQEDPTKAISIDKKSGKYINFKSSAFWGFSISEKKVFKMFITYLAWVFDQLYHSQYWDELHRLDSREWEIYQTMGKRYIAFLEEEYPFLRLEQPNKYPKRLLGEIGKAQFDWWNHPNTETKDFYHISLRSEWERLKNDFRTEILTDDESLYQIQEKCRLLLKKEVISLGIYSSLDDMSVWERLNEKRRWKMRLEAYVILADIIEKNKPQKLEEVERIRASELALKMQEKKKKMAEQAIIPEKYAELEYPYALAKKKIDAIQKEIDKIDKEILELGEATDIEQFFRRLPEVLSKTFELSSKVLHSEEIETMKDDIYKLIEITTFELSIDTEKELQIKLFEVLETLKNWWFLNGAPDKNRTCV
jgi:hypothetical protein